MICFGKVPTTSKPTRAWAIAWERCCRKKHSALLRPHRKEAAENAAPNMSIWGCIGMFLPMNPKFSAYAHPEALGDGDWLQQHLYDPSIRIVESNEDVLLYDTGHIPGAVHIAWRGDLQDNTEPEYVSPERFA